MLRRHNTFLVKNVNPCGKCCLQIKVKMTEVQHQLQDLKSRLDTDSPEEYSHEERALMNRVEELKEEFKELLAELRRKKAGEGAIMSDDVCTTTHLNIK